jgi:hypothetical protein
MAYVHPEDGEVVDRETPGAIDEHDIYDQGYDACEAGEDEDTNPWPVDSYAGMVWSDGWADYDMNER